MHSHPTNTTSGHVLHAQNKLTRFCEMMTLLQPRQTCHRSQAGCGSETTPSSLTTHTTSGHSTRFRAFLHMQWYNLPPVGVVSLSSAW